MDMNKRGARANMSEPEIFSDNITSPKEEKKVKSLSKMTKPELYEFSKELVKENMKLKFLNSVGDNQETVEKIEFLENKILDLEKEIEELENDNEELIEKFKKENNKVCNLVSKIHQTFSPEECKRIVKENEELKKEKELFKSGHKQLKEICKSLNNQLVEISADFTSSF